MSGMADDRMDRLPERLPLFGEELPGAHISLHAVVVRRSVAWFDEEAIHGHSVVEAGVRWVASRDALPEPERWGVVWVAVTHGVDGARAYTGIAADELWIDPRARLGYREAGRQARRMDAVMRGRIDVSGLTADERAAVREAMLMRDPDAWDRADPALQEALRTPARPSDDHHRNETPRDEERPGHADEPTPDAR